MSEDETRVLIVGETVFAIHTHFKGFASYETGYVTTSLSQFTARFEGMPLRFDFMPNHDVSREFPSTLEELQRFDVIVFSDAPADSFLLHPDTLAGERRPNRLAEVDRFVRAGGGFAMIGGWMSFGGFHGKAHYAYTPLANLLPVEIARGDDRMEMPQGVHPECLMPDHPILDRVSGEWPDLLGYNRFEATRGELLLRIGETGDPLLVVDRVEKGRVACFASDIAPHWGSPRFQAWDGYVPFWSNLLRWLGRGTEAD